MRDVLCGTYRASGSENKKPTWASGRSRLRERSWFEARVSLAHPGLSPIHRGRSRPGWRSRRFTAGSFLMRRRNCGSFGVRPDFFSGFCLRRSTAGHSFVGPPLAGVAPGGAGAPPPRSLGRTGRGRPIPINLQDSPTLAPAVTGQCGIGRFQASDAHAYRHRRGQVNRRSRRPRAGIAGRPRSASAA
jgi:hypothetical protein